MPSTETLLAIILVGILLNFALALVILGLPRLRRGEGADGGRSRTASPGRTSVPVFAPMPQAHVQTDPLTGLDTGITWDRWLTEEDARIKRYRRPATVVLIELDGIERLVDRLGTTAAERLIPPVATTMRRYARQSDGLARLGQARFGALLRETDEVQAVNYVERIRSQTDLWLAAGAVSLRVSAGWAEANGARGLDVAVQAAEERLLGERRRDSFGNGGGGSRDEPLVEPAVG